MERGLANITAPARLEYTRGALRCTRIVPARLAYRGSSVLTTAATGTTTLAEIPELDRLTFADRLSGETDMQFMRRAAIWQKTMLAIESAFEAVNQRVDEVAILARLATVEAKAEVANDNAIIAQTTATQASTAVETTFSQIDQNLADFYASLAPFG